MDLAARTALGTTIGFLNEYGQPDLVRFVLFSNGSYGAFSAALEKLMQADA
jgi:hypothetical protein